MWRDGGDVPCRVSRHQSLAHVMRLSDLPARTPLNGIDTEPLVPYVAALDDPGNASASFEYTSSHCSRYRTDLKPNDVISIQIAWHHGWHAEVNGRGKPGRKRRTWVHVFGQPSRSAGPTEIKLEYEWRRNRKCGWRSGLSPRVRTAPWLLESRESRRYFFSAIA